MDTKSSAPCVMTIEHEGSVHAIVVSSRFTHEGIHFFTQNSFSQQLAYMKHPAGKKILPHVHNPVPREIQFTHEVLVVKSGRLRVDFYSKAREYLESFVLVAGDVILLADGGHGFEVLEELEMFEIKQGPYAGEADKTRFDCPVPNIIERRRWDQ